MVPPLSLSLSMALVYTIPCWRTDLPRNATTPSLAGERPKRARPDPRCTSAVFAQACTESREVHSWEDPHSRGPRRFPGHAARPGCTPGSGEQPGEFSVHIFGNAQHLPRWVFAASKICTLERRCQSQRRRFWTVARAFGEPSRDFHEASAGPYVGGRGDFRVAEVA